MADDLESALSSDQGLFKVAARAYVAWDLAALVIHFRVQRVSATASGAAAQDRPGALQPDFENGLELGRSCYQRFTFV
jgi:hypothetical protein